jgi:transposase-like protein
MFCQHLGMGIATVDTRKRAIKAYLNHQGTQAQIAELCGINIRTFQNWRSLGE